MKNLYTPRYVSFTLFTLNLIGIYNTGTTFFNCLKQIFAFMLIAWFDWCHGHHSLHSPHSCSVHEKFYEYQINLDKHSISKFVRISFEASFAFISQANKILSSLKLHWFWFVVKPIQFDVKTICTPAPRLGPLFRLTFDEANGYVIVYFGNRTNREATTCSKLMVWHVSTRTICLTGVISHTHVSIYMFSSKVFLFLLPIITANCFHSILLPFPDATNSKPNWNFLREINPIFNSIYTFSNWINDEQSE